MMVWDPGYPNTGKNTWAWIKLGYTGTPSLDHGASFGGKDPSSKRPQLTRHAAAGPRRERGAPNDPRQR